jgi:hypothetical protein
MGGGLLLRRRDQQDPRPALERTSLEASAESQPGRQRVLGGRDGHLLQQRLGSRARGHPEWRQDADPALERDRLAAVASPNHGSRWSRVASPHLGTTSQLVAVSAKPAGNLWAVGSYFEGADLPLAIHCC